MQKKGVVPENWGQINLVENDFFHDNISFKIE